MTIDTIIHIVTLFLATFIMTIIVIAIVTDSIIVSVHPPTEHVIEWAAQYLTVIHPSCFGASIAS